MGYFASLDACCDAPDPRTADLDARLDAMADTFLTNDASEITRVWASFSTNDIFPEASEETMTEEELEELVNGPGSDERFIAAYNTMADAIAAEFPAADDVMIEFTGWDGDMAQFSPRAETRDGRSYEPFYNWLDEVCQSLGGN